jgi:hypothetical protein
MGRSGVVESEWSRLDIRKLYPLLSSDSLPDPSFESSSYNPAGVVIDVYTPHNHSFVFALLVSPSTAQQSWGLPTTVSGSQIIASICKYFNNNSLTHLQFLLM